MSRDDSENAQFRLTRNSVYAQFRLTRHSLQTRDSPVDLLALTRWTRCIFGDPIGSIPGDADDRSRRFCGRICFNAPDLESENAQFRKRATLRASQCLWAKWANAQFSAHEQMCSSPCVIRAEGNFSTPQMQALICQSCGALKTHVQPTNCTSLPRSLCLKATAPVVSASTMA